MPGGIDVREPPHAGTRPSRDPYRARPDPDTLIPRTSNLDRRPEKNCREVQAGSGERKPPLVGSTNRSDVQWSVHLKERHAKEDGSRRRGNGARTQLQQGWDAGVPRFRESSALPATSKSRRTATHRPDLDDPRGRNTQSTALAGATLNRRGEQLADPRDPP
jgi:hypothetical protein